MKKRTLRKDQRGAVLKHAAMCAARAAVVIENPQNMNPAGPDEKHDRGDVELAAYLGLGDFYTKGNFDNVSVKVTNPSGDVHGLVTVDVTATYTCDVPLGGLITCAAGGGSRTKTESASLPLQGAKYDPKEK